MVLSKSKIFITGAGGFIGYNLSRALSRDGHHVIGVDTHYPIVEAGSECDLFQAEIADYRDAEKMQKWLYGVDYVVHLASAHLQISLDSAEYWDVNVHGLKTFLSTAQSTGVRRFIHVSSVGVYGDLQELPADEESICRPQSIYGETKLAGEKEVLSFSRDYDFPVVILRPAWVYGPYCPRTQKIYKTLEKGRFVMIGNGQNLRHPIYISDMIEAIRKCIESDLSNGNTFIIAGEKAITTRQLVECFCNKFELPYPKISIPYWMGYCIATISERIYGLLKKEPPISKRSLEFFDTNNAFDITKAKNILDFNPLVSFDDGLEHTMDWLKKT